MNTMSTADYIVLTVIAIWVILAVRYMIKQKKQGKCSCCESCMKCKSQGCTQSPKR